ncbi:Ribosomal RNA small subunit methyltransferase A [Methanoculleus chikugoensis]|jgi:16S rRNA (adenine1518-N6/adenine1519-N6)-dimethyltransferase|uniref:Probable ribosomal RNA small subunit methyltransferase A n=1 Tax=Methanoculleus chikugoensis TaxID=118126 RepID=A0A1M4MHN8_9EURY|nr:16S rRNA (adenine(1518)-N(6)/adenine(1519)-N(6))-dimethyltransferase RsmA [Methanoculleus chikugoensis]MDD4566924.1 16S rRNA (adenine(1518)-N(6)/adenine(1519)-N(6))-dimethyltransferase RsmA [Methanoculleus chikugoensis]NMA10550.1 16S ribosomal RNA methyltransferase A [Methanomicrobiales archaeon]SCL74421.1 Ribosomal RNA small subunit methyltransferase A [Methanoculleus chikugoensis]
MSAPRDQHFLVDRRAVEKIAGFVEVSGRRVLEIGPGEGILTRALLDRGATVIAVEIDPALVEELEIAFADEIEEGRLEIIHGDAKKVDIPPFDIVVANLPYSVSSKLTFRLLEIGFEVAILMYQKEFARRMIAPPGTPNVGRLSVMVQTYASVKPLLDLGPGSFRPQPQVRSWVVRITPHEPPYPVADRRVYADVVRVLFSHRRKTVRKGLRSGKDAFPAQAIERAIVELPDDLLQRRPEDLMLEEFALIANTLAGS